MLDMKIVRQDPEKIQKMLRDRYVEFDLDSLLDLDKKRRECILSTDDLRKKKNEMSLKIAETKKAGQDADKIIQEMQLVSRQLTELEETQNKTELEYSKLILTLPNIFDQTVPIGEDSSANKEVKKWGDIPKV